MGFLKRLFGRKMSHDEQVLKWQLEHRVYTQRKWLNERLLWVLRRMEKSGYLNMQRNMRDLITWTISEKALLEREYEEQLEKSKEQYGTVVPPQIQNDAIPMLGECVGLLETLEPDAPEENVVRWLETRAAESNLELKESMEHMILEMQLALEEVKGLVCRPDADWKKAGDVWMPIDETHNQLGIRHEILNHVDSFDDGLAGQDEFDYKLDQHIMEIETRLEKEKRLKKEG